MGGDAERRIAGALLGVHVGDSLGATTEFASRDEAQRLLPADVAQVEIVGGGAFDWAPGAATDDTDLTLAILRGYRETDLGASHDVVHAAARHMLLWFQGGPHDVGSATAEGLRAYARSGDPFRSGVGHDRSQGNGSLMRTLPVALARRDDVEVRADEASALSGITHAHRVCRDACVVYCDLVVDLVAPGRIDRDRSTLRDRLAMAVADVRLAPQVREAITAGTAARSVAEVAGVNGPSSGWVLTSLAVAVAALADPRPAADVLLDVVRLGGDADTNGAITGGLLGARDGLDAWPDRWRQRLEHGDELLAAATFLGG